MFRGGNITYTLNKQLMEYTFINFKKPEDKIIYIFSHTKLCFNVFSNLKRIKKVFGDFEYCFIYSVVLTDFMRMADVKDINESKLWLKFEINKKFRKIKLELLINVL